MISKHMLSVTFFVVGAAGPAAFGQDDRPDRGDIIDCVASLATAPLPKAPSNLGEDGDRLAYVQQMARTLSDNSDTIGQTLERVASRSEHFDYVRRNLGDGRKDPERMTVLKAGDELNALTDSLKIGGKVTPGEVVTQADGAARKVARRVVTLPVIRKMVPAGLEVRLSQYGHKKVDYRQLVQVIEDFIKDVRNRMYSSYDEIQALKQVIDAAEAQAASYGEELDRINDRIKNDTTLTAKDREFLEASIAKPLAAAIKRLVEQIALYRLVIEQKFVFLQGAGPVIENTASTAKMVIPAMQVVQNQHEDSTALRHLNSIAPKLNKSVQQMLEASTATLERTARESREAELQGPVTPEFVAGHSARLDQVKAMQDERNQNLLPNLLKAIDGFNQFNERQREKDRLISAGVPAISGPRE